MKTNLTIILCMLLFIACKKEETAIIEETGSTPELTTGQSSDDDNDDESEYDDYNPFIDDECGICDDYRNNFAGNYEFRLIETHSEAHYDYVGDSLEGFIDTILDTTINGYFTVNWDTTYNDPKFLPMTLFLDSTYNYTVFVDSNGVFEYEEHPMGYREGEIKNDTLTYTLSLGDGYYEDLTEITGIKIQ